MSLHYLVKNECQKLVSIWDMYCNYWQITSSIAKHLRCDDLLYYAFIIQSAGERIFKIGEHLVKLKAKWLVVACAPFALHFCPQRRWSRQINWITCVLWTETVTNHCYVNRQINMSNYQQVSNCCRPVLTYWPTDWCHQWLTDCWSCTAFCCDSFSLLWQLCTVGHWIFLYGRCKQLSVGELHTHTRLMALCPGLPRWAGTRKVKPIWILLKQETVSGSGIS